MFCYKMGIYILHIYIHTHIYNTYGYKYITFYMLYIIVWYMLRHGICMILLENIFLFVIFYWSIPGYTSLGFPCGLALKNLPAVQDTWRCRFNPWVGKIPLEKGIASHSSILAWRIRMDRGAWWAIVHGVPKESDTPERLSNRYDVMCKWCHVGFVFLFLLLVWHLWLHPCCCKWRHFILFVSE